MMLYCIFLDSVCVSLLFSEPYIIVLEWSNYMYLVFSWVRLGLEKQCGLSWPWKFSLLGAQTIWACNYMYLRLLKSILGAVLSLISPNILLPLYMYIS